MSDLRLPTVQTNGFALEASVDGRNLTLRLRGNADMHAIEPVESYLASLHAEAQRLKASGVLVDLHDLEFMNSSCFKSFVNWINRIRALETESRYRIQFRSNANVYWQRRSLQALRAFAAELVSIEA